MDIIVKLNKRLTLVEGGVCHGGEEKIKKILSESPVNLPDDYIEFLRIISGEENVGIGFAVDGTRSEIFIWSAGFALDRRAEDYSHEVYKKVTDCCWLVGDDLGGLVYFYGNGNEGFGLYRGTSGGLDISDSDKIADSLTNFLVDGVGIDVAITL